MSLVYKDESSAKISLVVVPSLVFKGKSFMYKQKRSRPKINPWGTSEEISLVYDFSQFV